MAESALKKRSIKLDEDDLDWFDRNKKNLGFRDLANFTRHIFFQARKNSGLK